MGIPTVGSVISQPSVPTLVSQIPPSPSNQGTPSQQVWPDNDLIAPLVAALTSGRIPIIVPALVGDVIGPSNANVVSNLTGVAGTVGVAAGALKVAGATLSIEDSGAVVRDVFDTTHGRITAGGGGTDFKTVMGPLVGLETGNAGIYFLPNASSAGPGNNWGIQGDGTNLVLNAMSAVGAINLYVGNTGSLTAQFEAAANLFPVPLTFDGRTAAATTGDIRGPKDFTIKNRNAGNTADNLLIGVDGADDITVGSQTTTANVSILAVTGGGITLAAGTNFIDGTTTTFRDAGHGVALTFNLNSAGATSIQAASTVTFSITQASSLSGGTAMKIAAQAAGGLHNDGGPLQLTGGLQAGPTSQIGSVQVQSPFNGGYFTIAIAGATTLTPVQSAFNAFKFTGALGAGVQVTFTRQIADTSWVFVRNLTGQTLTFAYLSGGTVNVANNASAFICSDGTNLQLIMVGT